MTNEQKINAKTGKPKVSSRGGVRPNAGRPKGSSNKLKMEDLLQDLELVLGKTYSEQIAENYVLSIGRSDWASVRDYDKILLGKIIADRQAVEVTDSAESVEAKKAAFADALASMTGIKKE